MPKGKAAGEDKCEGIGGKETKQWGIYRCCDQVVGKEVEQCKAWEPPYGEQGDMAEGWEGRLGGWVQTEVL